MPADADTYEAGQLLVMAGGLLKAISAATTTTPPYVSAAEKVIDEKGDILPVNRVSTDVIYKTSLSAAAASAVPGGKLQVSAGGKQVSTGAGTFEIVSLEETTADSTVYGRFL